MNIKTCMRISYEKIRKSISDDMDRVELIRTIVEVWHDLRVYYKNMNKGQFDYYDALISFAYNNDLVITNDMIIEGLIILRRMKECIGDVVGFKEAYYKLVCETLVFNSPNEVICERCQGILFFFYDHRNSRIVLKCDTCGAVYDTFLEELDYNKIGEITPVTKTQLELLLKKDLKNLKIRQPK